MKCTRCSQEFQELDERLGSQQAVFKDNFLWISGKKLYHYKNDKWRVVYCAKRKINRK